jgi:alpha-L-arabinofuranosidase
VAGEVILKLVNPGAEPSDVAIRLDGVASVAGEAQATVLSGERDDDVNGFDDPTRLVPTTMTIGGVGARFERRLAPRSLTVLRIGASVPPEAAKSR